jgi:ferredoxin/flavodoxin---NADP+ reductase
LRFSFVNRKDGFQWKRGNDKRNYRYFGLGDGRVRVSVIRPVNVQYSQPAHLEGLNAVVTFRNDLAPGLMTLRVAPAGWTFPAFEAGQYVSLGLFGSAPRSRLAEPERLAPEPEKLIRRPYSIASSSENRAFLEFYINLVPTGVLTPRLFNIEVGDRISLGSKVAGAFTLKSVPEEANVILIATGTGLAPYVSMLMSSSGLERRGRIALIHGVRQSLDLGYRSVFRTLQTHRHDFTYLPVVSRPQLEASPWMGASGHVQDVWNGDALEQAWGFRPRAENTHVLLCGSPEMIESMTAIWPATGSSSRLPGSRARFTLRNIGQSKRATNPKRTTQLCAAHRSMHLALECVSGGEAQSKHKEGFDPPERLLCVNEFAVRYGAGPSFRTVGLDATVARSF